MNLKKSLAGLFAGFALLGALAAPAALAQDAGTITVGVTDPGVFNAYFCVPNDPTGTHTTTYGLTQVQWPTAQANGKATGTLALCYQDTKSYRPSFDVKVAADNFRSSDASVYTPITSVNFKITHTENVGQVQWDSMAGNTLGRIGDIGYYLNEADPPGGQHATNGNWTTANTFDVARKVHFGYSGRGTVASGGAFDVELTIPTGTTAGTYVSNITLTITPSSMP
jgi:hypothetical protein